jgi:hypothetical protein
VTDSVAELTPPILIDEHGDISAWASSARAAGHVEAIDVINGEYEFFDAVGRRLVAAVDNNRISLGADPARPPEPERLEAALRGYFRRLPERCRSYSDAADRAQTLAELVDLRWKLGHGPRPR